MYCIVVYIFNAICRTIQVNIYSKLKYIKNQIYVVKRFLEGRWWRLGGVLGEVVVGKALCKGEVLFFYLCS